MESPIHLIYASTATVGLSAGELGELLRVSRRNNTRLGVTGMLLFTEGSFFQVLEGEADVVDRVFDNITADARHVRPVTIIRERIARRSFGDWSMGFATATPRELNAVAGMNDFFDAHTCVDQMDAGRARKLLRAFRDGRWRARLESRPRLDVVPRRMANA